MHATGNLIRKLWLTAKLVGGLVVAYLLIYLLLSLCGQYRPMSEGGLGHWTEYSVWAPVGFYDPHHSPPGSVAAKRGIIIGTWRYTMVVQIFWPLWLADTAHIHKTKTLRYIHETEVDGKWITTTNNATEK